MICRGKAAKKEFLGYILNKLWQGRIYDVLIYLEGYRENTKNKSILDSLIFYLAGRAEYIPNQKERRLHRKYTGSGHVEKANDLIVARRQKHKGMHWGWETSDSLAALRTLVLNHGWDQYWMKNQVLPLAIPVKS